MSCIQLNNPQTETYCQFKNYVLSGGFPWFWIEDTLGLDKTSDTLDSYSDLTEEQKKSGKFGTFSMFHHQFLKRPGTPDTQTNSRLFYPVSTEDDTKGINQLLCEIFQFNNIKLNVIYRIGANSVFPEKTIISSLPHVDHEFPHKNLLIYLTDSGGDTFVEGEPFRPKEDNIISYEGMHWHETPKDKRRVVLVVTYL